MNTYQPEGSLLSTRENSRWFTPEGLERARVCGKILEGRATLCDKNNNLIVDLGGLRGMIPREEAVLGEARNIAIISRVGKPVCFKVLKVGEQILLSRRAAQLEAEQQYLSSLTPGDIINAKITHIEQFGAFADVGCGLISLLPIDAISVSRISHPRERFRVGQSIKAVVRGIDLPRHRLTLSHRELLGSWEENAALFSPGMTVAGTVRGVEEYGIFVELSENLAGLAECREGVRDGQAASVYIKSILPEKMKIKLVIVEVFDTPLSPSAPHYFITEGHIDRWRYSPSCCGKQIESVF